MILWIYIISSSVLLGWLSYTNYALAVRLVAGLLPLYLVRVTLLGIPTNIFELSILAVLIGSLFNMAVISTLWQKVWKQLPDISKILAGTFIFSAVIATIVSSETRVSLGILKGWFLVPLLFGWLITTISSNIEERLTVWHSLRWSAIVVAILGLLQIGTLSRVTSIYDVPNSLALFLVPITVATIWQRRWFSSSILTTAIVATQSVSAFMALLVTLLIGYWVWMHPRTTLRRSHALIAGMLIMIVGGVLVLSNSGRLAYLIQPLFGGPPNSVSVRLQLWQASLSLIRQHPWVGIGLGQFEPAYQNWLHQQFIQYESGQSVARPLPEFVFRDPHNWIFSMWLNLGFLGLGSFVAWHLYILNNFWQRRDKLSLVDQSTLLALLSLLLFGVTEAIYWKNDLAALQWLLFALATVVVHRAPVQTQVLSIDLRTAD